MFRTVLTLGILALAALFALKLFFGILGGLLGLFGALVGLAVKVLLVGALVYLAIRLFSPETARRLRQKWSDSNT